MKNMYFIKVAVITVILSLLVSCDTALSGTFNFGKKDNGTVTVNLPSVENRGWFNSDVKNMVNSYEIIAFNNEEQMTSGLLTEGGKHTLSLPPGTYDIVVLAGSGYTVWKDLLGVGESENVLIQESKDTTVTIGLDAPTITTTWPYFDVEAGSTFDIDVTLDLKISSLEIRKTGSSSGYVQWAGSNKSFVWTREGNVWSGSVTLETLLSESSHPAKISSVNFIGLYLKYSNAPDFEVGVHSVAEGNWSMPDYNTFPENSAMYGEFNKTINTVLPLSQSSVSVDVSWNPDSI